MEINNTSEDHKMLARFLEILHRVDQLSVLDSRTPDQIIGYDEQGLRAAQCGDCEHA